VIGYGETPYLSMDHTSSPGGPTRRYG